MSRWIKRCGAFGFAFFLVKGLAWLAVAGLACSAVAP
jgi:hypothetical protein